MEKCVADVTAKGKPKKNAIAICYASIMGKGGGKKKDAEDEFILDAATLDPALLIEGMDVEETEDEEGKAFAASDKPSDYLVAEDPKHPTTWHLQVRVDGKPDHRLMGAAWAALTDPQGHRGQKYEGPGKAEAVKKLRAMYQSEKLPVPGAEKDMREWIKEQFEELREALGFKAKSPRMVDCPECNEKMPKGGECPGCGYEAADGEEAPAKKSLSEGSLVYKDKDTGAYRWLAVFTNKFRDRDNPPEIICDAAHRDFVKAVNAGEWPMPEYRLWHIPAPVGRADLLAYHDAGFVVASGTITKGLEPIAELMAAAPFRWINSHGMPKAEIRRDDPQDETVITRYRSKEITALPEWAAANELTMNLIETEEKMAGFNDSDRERLSKMFGDKAAVVEELLSRTGEKATEAGVESKEVKEEQTEEQPKEEAPAEQQPPTRAEVADAMKPVVDAMRDLADQLVGLKKELADYKAESEQKEKARAEETLARTPAASLSELLVASITKNGDNEAKVKGRTGLKGPAEAPEKPPAPTGSGGAMDIPFIARWVQASQEGAAKTEQL